MVSRVAPAELAHVSGSASKLLNTQRSSLIKSAVVTQLGLPTTNVLIAARFGYSITQVRRRTDRLPWLASEPLVRRPVTSEWLSQM